METATIRFDGSAVRRARREGGLTATQLAASIGVSEKTVARIERGENAPAFGTAAQIAKVLGVSLDSLAVHTPDADTPAVAGEESPHNHEPGAASDSSGARLAHQGG